jgi:LacI family transcriptional regulator
MPTAEVVRTGFDRRGGYKAGLDLSAASVRLNTGNTALHPHWQRRHGNGSRSRAALQGDPNSGRCFIPDDASIAGFDGTELLRDFRPVLSTVRLPLELIGHLATVGEAADGGFSPPIEGEVVLSGALA